MGDRLHLRLHRRRRHRRRARQRRDRPISARHLLRRRAFPLHDVARRGVFDLRRLLLLVPEDDRLSLRREAGEVAFLDDRSSASTSLSSPSISSASRECRAASSTTPTPMRCGISCRRSAPLSRARARSIFLYLIYEAFAAKRAAAANPWGPGATTLEWTVPSPAPFHTFETPPHIFGDEDHAAPAIAGHGSLA